MIIDNDNHRTAAAYADNVLNIAVAVAVDVDADDNVALD